MKIWFEFGKFLRVLKKKKTNRNKVKADKTKEGGLAELNFEVYNNYYYDYE